MDLSLETRQEDDHTIVQIAGEIDVYSAPQLRECLANLAESGQHRLLIDLEKVDFLDSTALGVLVGGLKRARAEGGSMALVCTQERLIKIFRITGLTKVFQIHDSVPSAIAAKD